MPRRLVPDFDGGMIGANTLVIGIVVSGLNIEFNIGSGGQKRLYRFCRQTGTEFKHKMIHDFWKNTFFQSSLQSQTMVELVLDSE